MFISENYRLHCQMRPVIRGYVHIYNYQDLSDFDPEHLEKLYGELLSCQAFNMQAFNELILFDEFMTGVCMGYIKPESMKADLLERITDVVYDDLNSWVVQEYDLELRSGGRSGPELHEVLWDSEMRDRARDHNASITPRE